MLYQEGTGYEPSLKKLVYWMYNKLKNLGDLNNIGGGNGGVSVSDLNNGLDSKLNKGSYNGTAQDLKNEIDGKSNSNHSHNWSDITNKPRISVTLADNAISRTYTIGLTGANGSSGRLIIPKAVSWNDVTDKPTIPNIDELHKIKHLDNVGRYDISLSDNGKIFHVKGNCIFNYNTMPELCSISVRKVSDNGEITFVGSISSINNGGDKLDGKKGSTAVIDYGLENQIFIDFRNV